MQLGKSKGKIKIAINLRTGICGKPTPMPHVPWELKLERKRDKANRMFCPSLVCSFT